MSVVSSERAVNSDFSVACDEAWGIQGGRRRVSVQSRGHLKQIRNDSMVDATPRKRTYRAVCITAAVAVTGAFGEVAHA